MRLSEAIDTYIQHKRTCGFRFTTSAEMLMSFCKHVGDLSLESMTVEEIPRQFLYGPRTSTVTCRKKHSLLNHFFEYWWLHKQMPKLILPSPPLLERRFFRPYIFSRAEIHLLLTKTELCQKFRNCVISACTLRMLLLTLYATGALCREVLNLRRQDISLKESRITIHGTSIMRHRCIPVAQELKSELKTFLRSKPRKTVDHELIFLTTSGEPISLMRLQHRFRRLRRLAGIVRNDGSTCQPRMHDLRATFAVHRITSWIKSGADLDRMLPALAAYMGNIGLYSTEQYLEMTPERFRKQLQIVSPQRGRKRWRDDPDLMEFLSCI